MKNDALCLGAEVLEFSIFSVYAIRSRHKPRFKEPPGIHSKKMYIVSPMLSVPKKATILGWLTFLEVRVVCVPHQLETRMLDHE